MLDMIQKGIYLEKCNKSLEDRIGWLEQKELAFNVELINLHQIEGENTMEVIESIAQELKLNEKDIEKVWRVKGEGLYPRPVVIRLRTKEARIKWLKSRKTRLTNKDGTRIYINENLTRQMRQLFWSTKQQLREMYKFIWIQNGKILIKKNEEEKKIFTIRCESDLNKFISNNIENKRE